MTEVPFHATRMGRSYYEHTLPELVRQVARLNGLLEQFADALEDELTQDPHEREDATT